MRTYGGEQVDEEATVRQPRDAAGVFVELADALVEPLDVVDFLQVLTDRSGALLGASAAGLGLADQRGSLHLMARTGGGGPADFLEQQLHAGPGHDVFSTGVAVVDVDLAAVGERWPALGPAALGAAPGRVTALPLRWRGTVLGALAVVTPGDVRLSGSEVAVGQAMADVATVGLLQARSTAELVVLSEQLQTALQDRIVVDQAKGVLAATAGTSIPEAFRRLRRTARRRGVPLSVLAADVVAGRVDADLLDGR
ncbi:GAF and ANTAR domain-containing protein [Kineococcus rubinsiae]|uniref:GAF and ANTAR domain-containing protein n=1 Tax=Kineococcus rubinsiae TaxID=2609562 RepID=UPI0027E3CBDE|nr:GAF and ANTAR domain-containing protein [Kineococcus rubinsiae]